jgi:hypothetical protein
MNVSIIIHTNLKNNSSIDGLGSIPIKGKKFVSAPQYPDGIWGPPSLLSMGTGSFSPELKRPGREADHSPPSGAEIKNVGAIHPCL